MVSAAHSAVFGLVLACRVRRDLMVAPLAALLSGALVGTPVGVWGLATLPASWLRRLIGLLLMGVVLIEWSRIGTWSHKEPPPYPWLKVYHSIQWMLGFFTQLATRDTCQKNERNGHAKQ